MMENYTLITGASGGIGLELANVFAENGHNIIFVARNEKRLREVAEDVRNKYEVNTQVIAADLSQENAADVVYEQTKNNEWEVDILINNVGFGDHNCFFDTSWERQKNMLDINIAALMHMTYLFGGDMRRRNRGKILNLSSIASLCAGPYMSVYYASKVFVRSFSEALHEELAPYNVTVTALCPGPTDTAFQQNANLENSNMFKILRVSEASAVARRGYRGLMRGKAIVYCDISAKVFALSSRIFPGKLARKITLKINGIKIKRQ